jgi:hypothetical protein
MLAFKVGRQQSNDTPILHRSVELFKRRHKASVIEDLLFDLMLTVSCCSCATALKNNLGFEICRPDGMI